MLQRLTRATAVAVRNHGKTPVARLTAVTSNTTHSWLAGALARHRVTRRTQRTDDVTLAEICHPSDITLSFVHLLLVSLKDE